MGHKRVRPTHYHYDHKVSNRRRGKKVDVDYPKGSNRTTVVVCITLILFLSILIFALYEKFSQ